MTALTGERYFGSTKFSDVTILVSDGEIKAHKIILAHSEYFDTCFNDKFIVRQPSYRNREADRPTNFDSGIRDQRRQP